VVNKLDQSFIHLGLGATAIVQPPFTGMDWYEGYGARHHADGAEGRLVSLYHFAESWTSWEMLPLGEEVVICTAGTILLHQEMADGSTASIKLGMGDHAINPRGCWHTADLDQPASAIFITPGLGTQNRPR
jgi:hypothetical protein